MAPPRPHRHDRRSGDDHRRSHVRHRRSRTRQLTTRGLSTRELTTRGLSTRRLNTRRLSTHRLSTRRLSTRRLSTRRDNPGHHEHATTTHATTTHATTTRATSATASPASTASNRAAADALIYAPTTRTLKPTAVHGTSGTVTSPQNVLTGASTRISGTNSYLVLDFGKEVGGLVTLTFAGASGSGQQVGLAFTESSLYTGTISDLSSGAAFSGAGTDGAIYATVNGAGSYTMPADKLRGGFRYLTVFMATSGYVDLNGVSLAFTGAAGAANPHSYANYFYSNDALLNKIWYAGAYTVQMDTITPSQGRVWPPPSSGWENNGLIGVGTSDLVDGAKRDRSVWPGDLGVSLPTEYVSTDDVVATKNALTTLYQHQSSSGELEYGGPQFNFYGSDTYHTWSLVGTEFVLHLLRRQGLARLDLERIQARHELHQRQDRRHRPAERDRHQRLGPRRPGRREHRGQRDPLQGPDRRRDARERRGRLGRRDRVGSRKPRR